MKKTTILLFVLTILLIGVWRFSGQRTQSPVIVLAGQEQIHGTPAPKESQPEVENLLDWLKAGTYSYRFTRATQTATIAGLLAVRGEDFAVDLHLPQGVMKIIYQNGATTVFDPHHQLEISLDTPLPAEIMPLSYEFTQKMQLVGKGKQKIAGITYLYQDYEALEQKARFYLVDNQVVMIAPHFREDSNWLIALQDVSKDLPSDAFVNTDSNFTRI